jgi:hypothetical protein
LAKRRGKREPPAFYFIIMNINSTASNVRKTESSHWYTRDGKPCYEIEKKDGSGLRPTTLADARKLNLLPSVTTILSVLDKPNLTSWKIEQAVNAVLTTPRSNGEALDAFVQRVLQQERQQDDESKKAMQLGTDVHNALELHLQGKPYPEHLRAYVAPVMSLPVMKGIVISTEQIVVGDRYAGRTDLIIDNGNVINFIDFKTAKKLPEKGSWDDHKLQLSAYIKAWIGNTGGTPIRSNNIYISTSEAGKCVCFDNGDWEVDYNEGFKPVVTHWYWKKGLK